MAVGLALKRTKTRNSECRAHSTLRHVLTRILQIRSTSSLSALPATACISSSVFELLETHWRHAICGKRYRGAARNSCCQAVCVVCMPTHCLSAGRPAGPPALPAWHQGRQQHTPQHRAQQRVRRRSWCWPPETQRINIAKRTTPRRPRLSTALCQRTRPLPAPQQHRRHAPTGCF